MVAAGHYFADLMTNEDYYYAKVANAKPHEENSTICCWNHDPAYW
jgi:hypothetical protein